MGAGRWVFPIAILGILGVLAGVLATTDVTRAPEERYCRPGEPCAALTPTPPAPGDLTVQVGDVVLLEHVEYYNATNGFASYTSREDLYAQGKLKEGPVPIQVEGRLIQYRIPPEVGSNASHVFRGLLGLKVNQSMVSGKLPPLEEIYGVWHNTTRHSKILGTFTVTNTLRDGDMALNGFVFNFANSTALWTVQKARPVAVGDLVPCESGAPGMPWDCRLTAIDEQARSVTYTREIVNGRQYPPSAYFRLDPEFVPNVNLTINMVSASRFNLEWPLRVDDVFTLLQSRGDWSAGAYEVASASGNLIDFRFAPLRQGQMFPHLIGETIWWEFMVVSIDRP